jgi:hypothetical protein
LLDTYQRVYKGAKLGYINLMRDGTTIPTNQPLNNLKIMKTALLLTAGILLTGATAAVVVPAINGTAAPAQRVITQLANGTATFQHATAEAADEFTYTALVWDDQIRVTYSDGMQVFYSPKHNANPDGKNTITVAGDSTSADLEWNGTEAIFTTDNNTTKLGGFRKVFDELQANRQARSEWRAAQAERMAELDEESFDGMVSRLSKQVCVRAEGLSYITENTIVSQAMNPIIGNFEMSSSNSARWNNMNPQLRSKHVLGAMAYDCNNTMMMAAENGLNNAALGLGLLLNNY